MGVEVTTPGDGDEFTDGGRIHVGSPVPGQALPDPVDEEAIAAATDGSLASTLRAVGAKLQRTKTKDFDIPETSLVLRARTFKDAAKLERGMKTEVFIVRSTEALFLRDEETDDLVPIPKWGPQLAAQLGVDVENAAELVRLVLDNPVRLQDFASQLVVWMAGRAQQDEESLGE